MAVAGIAYDGGMLSRRTMLAHTARATLAAGLLGVTACRGRRNTTPTSPPAAADPLHPGELQRDVALPLSTAGSYVFAAVSIEGERAGTWLVDTGSSVTLVEQGVANRLGLEPMAEGRVRGIAGTQPIAWLEPTVVTLGPVAAPIERLGRMNLYRLNKAVRFPLSGIVGFDALADGPVTLDLGDAPGDGGEARAASGREASMVFHARSTFSPEASGMRSARMRRGGRLPMITADFGGGRATPLVIDTGQDRELTLPAKLASRWPGIFATDVTGGGMSHGIGGVMAGRETWVSAMSALGASWRDVPVKLEPGGRWGRVGMRLLRRLVLSFDAPRGGVWARPRVG